MNEKKQMVNKAAFLRTHGWTEITINSWLHPTRPNLHMSLQSAYYTQLRTEPANMRIIKHGSEELH